MSDKRKTSKLLEQLRQYRFQKQYRHMNKAHVSHDISESDEDSRSSSSSSRLTRVESDESQKSTPPKLAKPINSPPKLSRIKNRITLDDSDDDEPVQPKKFSRIKSFHSDHNYVSKLPQKRPADFEIKHTIKPAKKAKHYNSDEEENWSDAVVKDSDSDTSGDESTIPNYMSRTKQLVYDFLCTASEAELLQIQTCTEKKANAIIKERPFNGWSDMVTKFKCTKSLNTQLLNYALLALKTRDTVSKLMARCLDLAISTEEAIVEGATTLKNQPSILTTENQLKSYQMVGLNWLVVMHKQNLNGILADEMGLGKTIQVISFLAYLKETGQATHPHLIICPTSTMDNWAIEFTKWCPDLRVVIYHGNTDERKYLRNTWYKERFKTMDVIITTYNIIGSNADERRMFKHLVQLQYIVFDEAHMLKNMNTQRYHNLFNIRAMHRILLTGTPLQNNLLELMSLLNFVMPDMFARKIEHIKAYFAKNSKLNTDSLPEFEQEQINLAKRIMKPFVLRRLKDVVLKDLPIKTQEVIFCPLNETQKVKYDEMVEELRDWALNKGDGFSFMSSFMQLRKLANHPLTCRYFYKEEVLEEMSRRLALDSFYKENNKKYVLEDLSYMSDHNIHKLTLDHKCISKFKLNDPMFLESGKFSKLDELLPPLKAGGHRVVMFSQFVFILDLLEEYMRIQNHTFVRLDGSTEILERQELIDDFNKDSDIFVFLLTTKAGGVGINLTSADTVIIHDVDFNPYNDKQAEDRCHRLGQTRPVHVFRLVSEGTVEERIYSQAQNKLELEQGLIGDEEAENCKNVEHLLKEVLGLKK